MQVVYSVSSAVNESSRHQAKKRKKGLHIDSTCTSVTLTVFLFDVVGLTGAYKR